jgi:hypothetical protein
VPQQARLRVFSSILFLVALKEAKICLLLSQKAPIIRDMALGSHMEQNIAYKTLSRIYCLGRDKVFARMEIL